MPSATKISQQPSILNKGIKSQAKKKSNNETVEMADETAVLKLRSVVTQWRDGRKDGNSSRVHVFVWMQSGFSADRVGDMTVNNGVLEIKIKWPDTLLNKGRKAIFDQKQFQKNYFVSGQIGQPPHPAVVAINKAIHDLTETTERQSVKSTIKIKLPNGSAWDFTPKEISRHESVVLLEVQKDARARRIDSKVILMIDLTDDVTPDVETSVVEEVDGDY